MQNDGCCWTERISAFFDGEGAAWERWRCRAHARRCAACRAWLQDVGRGWAALRAELETAPDSRFVNAVMDGLDTVAAPVPARAPRAARSWPLQIVATGSVAALAGLALLPLVAEHREMVLARSCQTNVRQLSRALTSYAEDYDGRLPPASAWATAAARSARSENPLHCPLDSTLPALPSYGFSQSLSARPVHSLSSPAAIPLVYESEAGRFTARHNQLGHVAYLDGRVQAVSYFRPP